MTNSPEGCSAATEHAPTPTQEALAILKWLREPDHAEEFSLMDFTNWVNRRPVAEMCRTVDALVTHTGAPAQPAQVRADAIRECVVAAEIAHQSVVGHYGPEAGIGAEVAKRRILNLLGSSAAGEFSVTPEAQDKIQALDPDLQPTQRLRRAVEIARTNSPEQDRESDCKTNPESTGHSPKERGERVLPHLSAGTGALTPHQISLVNDMIHAWIDPEKKGAFREAFRSDCKRLLATVTTNEPQAAPVPPTELHWLGDRESSDATRHALDVTGCVMYFQREDDCLRFMRWVGELCSCGGAPGQPAEEHDISCPSSLSRPQSRSGE